MYHPEDGSWFDGFTEEVDNKLTEVADLLYDYNIRYKRSQRAEREAIIRRLFVETGEEFVIHSPFHCDYGNITIGNHFIGNVNLVILDQARVTIGERVFIGPNTAIYTIIHHLNAEERNRGVMASKPVTIGDNVWIGGNTVILPGVTIGEGAVIGAGSLVTKDIPPRTLAFGRPAVPVRAIE